MNFYSMALLSIPANIWYNHCWWKFNC